MNKVKPEEKAPLTTYGDKFILSFFKNIFKYN